MKITGIAIHVGTEWEWDNWSWFVEGEHNQNYANLKRGAVSVGVGESMNEKHTPNNEGK